MLLHRCPEPSPGARTRPVSQAQFKLRHTNRPHTSVSAENVSGECPGGQGVTQTPLSSQGVHSHAGVGRKRSWPQTRVRAAGDGVGGSDTGPSGAPSNETFQMLSLWVITDCQEGEASILPSALKPKYGKLSSIPSCEMGLRLHSPQSRAGGMKAVGAWPLSTLNQQGSVVWEVLPDWSTREAHVVDSVRCIP